VLDSPFLLPLIMLADSLLSRDHKWMLHAAASLRGPALLVLDGCNWQAVRLLAFCQLQQGNPPGSRRVSSITLASQLGLAGGSGSAPRNPMLQLCCPGWHVFVLDTEDLEVVTEMNKLVGQGP
jgi:hypothetical protein